MMKIPPSLVVELVNSFSSSKGNISLRAIAKLRETMRVLSSLIKAIKAKIIICICFWQYVCILIDVRALTDFTDNLCTCVLGWIATERWSIQNLVSRRCELGKYQTMSCICLVKVVGVECRWWSRMQIMGNRMQCFFFWEWWLQQKIYSSKWTLNHHITYWCGMCTRAISAELLTEARR